MSPELQVLGHPLRDRTSLEAVLGSAQGRYFGAGYRSVQYCLRQPQRQDGAVTGLGHVNYPPSWSTDAAGGLREPHLSSIDAVLLPLALLETVMSQQEFHAAGRQRITSLHLVAGATPFLALEAVPVHLTVESTGQDQQVRALVGNIKVGLTLTEQTAIDLRGHDGPAEGSVERASVYTALFRQVESTSWVRHSGSDTGRLTGEHVLDAPASAQPRGGFEALQWPAPTLVDYLVVMGQLTQALVYTAAGRHRATSGPLWMRTIDITSRGAPSALPASFASGIQLLRDRSIQRGGATLHDCKVEASTSTGVTALATLAYQEL